MAHSNLFSTMPLPHNAIQALLPASTVTSQQQPTVLSPAQSMDSLVMGETPMVRSTAPVHPALIDMQYQPLPHTCAGAWQTQPVNIPLPDRSASLDCPPTWQRGDFQPGQVAPGFGRQCSSPFCTLTEHFNCSASLPCLLRPTRLNADLQPVQRQCTNPLCSLPDIPHFDCRVYQQPFCHDLGAGPTIPTPLSLTPPAQDQLHMYRCSTGGSPVQMPVTQVDHDPAVTSPCPGYRARCKIHETARSGSRKHFSCVECKMILEQYFQHKTQFPNREQKFELRKQVGMDLQQLNTWFTNKRRAMKVSNTRHTSPSGSPAAPETTEASVPETKLGTFSCDVPLFGAPHLMAYGQSYAC